MVVGLRGEWMAWLCPWLMMRRRRRIHVSYGSALDSALARLVVQLRCFKGDVSSDVSSDVSLHNMSWSCTMYNVHRTMYNVVQRQDWGPGRTLQQQRSWGLSLSRTRTHTFILSILNIYIYIYICLSLARSCSLAHSLSLSLSHTHTLSLSHTHKLARSNTRITRTHAHTRTHTHTHLEIVDANLGLIRFYVCVQCLHSAVV
jgi:hypothetical protein